MRYFEKCVTSGSCLHLTVQKSRLWSYQKVIRLSSLIQSKLLEIIVDYIRGEQLLSALAAALNAPKSADWHLRIEEAVYNVLSKSFVRYGGADLSPAGRETDAISTLRECIAAGVRQGDDLSLSELAETVGLSPSYLIRSTRRKTGLTPHGLVLQERVEHAHGLLLAKTPAAEAAVLAGFYDQAHLIRQYRRHFGVTPGAVIQHS